MKQIVLNVFYCCQFFWSIIFLSSPSPPDAFAPQELWQAEAQVAEERAGLEALQAKALRRAEMALAPRPPPRIPVAPS